MRQRICDTLRTLTDQDTSALAERLTKEGSVTSGETWTASDAATMLFAALSPEPIDVGSLPLSRVLISLDGGPWEVEPNPVFPSCAVDALAIDLTDEPGSLNELFVGPGFVKLGRVTPDLSYLAIYGDADAADRGACVRIGYCGWSALESLAALFTNRGDRILSATHSQAVH